jgi:hypothetical protein
LQTPRSIQHGILATEIGKPSQEPGHRMQKNTGLKRVVMAGVYSLKAPMAAFEHEPAFRQGLIVFGVWLKAC